MLPTLTIDATWMRLVLLPAVVLDMDASSQLQSVICKRESGKRPLINKGIHLSQI